MTMAEDPTKYFQAPLYVRIDKTKQFGLVYALLYSLGRPRLYCHVCGTEVPFVPFPLTNLAYAFLQRHQGESDFGLVEITAGMQMPAWSHDLLFYHQKSFIEGSSAPDFVPDESIIVSRYKCSSNPAHVLLCWSMVTGNDVVKVGQLPSVTDVMHIDQKIQKELGDLGHYYAKAHGMIAHGSAISAMVYFRRIIEGLLSRAGAEAIKAGEATEAELRALHVAERFKKLGNRMDVEVLIEPETLYAILSQGIHTMDEAVCGAAFPLMKSNIDAMVQHRISHRDTARMRKEIGNSMTDLKSLLRQRKPEP